MALDLEQYQSRSRWSMLTQYVPTQWWVSIVVLTCVLEYAIFFPITGTRVIAGDAAIFLYGGDLLVEGYAPYLYWWDIKPPLIYDVTALIALVAPHDPWMQFYIGSMLTALATIATVALAGMVVYRVTQSNPAAIVSCLVIIGFVSFLHRPVRGIFPKPFVFALGLAAIWLSLDDRHVLAAACGVCAAGFWQFGLIFTAIPFARAWYHERDVLPEMVGVGAFCTILAVAPIVLLGGGRAMIHQVISALLAYHNGGLTIVERLAKLIEYTPLIWPLLLAGIAGVIEFVTRRRRHYWLLALIVWPIIQLGFLDFDFSPDVTLFVVACALGLGIAVGSLHREGTLTPHRLMLVLCCIGLLTTASIATNRQMFANHEGPPNPRDSAKVETFLEQDFPPESCLVSKGDYNDWSDTHPVAASQQRCAPPVTLPGE